jgi:hypothetical protein
VEKPKRHQEHAINEKELIKAPAIETGDPGKNNMDKQQVHGMEGKIRYETSPEVQSVDEPLLQELGHIENPNGEVVGEGFHDGRIPRR